MNMRGFLGCYLSALAFVGAAGAGAYHELQRRDEAVKLTAATSRTLVISIPLTAAPAPAVVAPTPPLFAAAAEPQFATTRLPKLRPHVVAQAKPLSRLPTHVTVVHVPDWPPPPPPPPTMPVVRYAYPAYPMYGGYYPYSYPPYGYRRSF